MKKKYRDKALQAMFSELHDKDFDIREHAMFQLGLMLERSNQGDDLANVSDIYSDNLTRDMLRLQLSDSEQNQVIDNFSRVIVTYMDSRPTAYWAFGKVDGRLGFAPLLSLIQATGNQLNNEAAYQACVTLKRWMQEGVNDDELVTEQLKLQDPTPLLERWLDSSDERLSTSADDVLDMLSD